jgi:hypothetical protein
MMELLQRGPRRSRNPLDLGTSLAFVAAGLLVIWSAYIHLHLWNGIYRHIPTIGPLFLLQAIGGFVLGVLIVAVRRVWAALLGVGFALSTMVGYLLSVDLPKGLFNWKESWSAPFAHLAFNVEIATIVVSVIAGALCLVGSAPTTTTVATPAGTST